VTTISIVSFTLPIRIVDSACRLEDNKLVIVLEGSGPDEVLSPTAKTMAIQKAASCGYNRLGVNKQSGSYPVDADGKTWDDLNEQSKAGKIAAYRNDIVLMSGL
jgi:hypothetical protein